MLRSHELVLQPFFLAACVFVSGCGGSVHEEPSDGGKGGDTSVTPATSLEGTWDVIGAVSGGTPTTGVIVIAPDHLAVTFGKGSLEFRAAGAAPSSLIWTERSLVEPLTLAQTPATVDLGVIPLALGGHFDITDPARPTVHCTGDLTTSSANAGCLGTHPSSLGGMPGLEDRIVGVRTTAAASRFGALGGTWTFDNSVGHHCDVSFIDNKVTLDLSFKGKDTGTMTILFADGLASGVTDHGVEFTARRR